MNSGGGLQSWGLECGDRGRWRSSQTPGAPTARAVKTPATQCQLLAFIRLTGLSFLVCKVEGLA